MSWGWKPYVPAWQRRQQAAEEMAALRRKGVSIQPVTLAGKVIAATFWGKAWCDHLEIFSDYDNRLPRGRAYVRNGSVCHLNIREGGMEAKVSGSSLYDVTVAIRTLPGAQWRRIRKACAGRIGSMLDLLQGRLSDQVMRIVTDGNDGLFPRIDEMEFNCTCPDWAGLCKHIAAVLYAVGARLDRSPELLFHLRGCDHHELIGKNAAKSVVAGKPISKSRLLNSDNLADVFGIDIETQVASKRGKRASRARKRGSKTTASRARRNPSVSRAGKSKPSGQRFTPRTGRPAAKSRKSRLA